MSFQSQFVSPSIEIFFGDKNDNTNLDHHFCRLKQIHSNTVLAATNLESPEADAHYTKTPNLHLCIFTADCMPIVFSDGETIAAAHAGWRGLFTGILTEVISSAFKDPKKVGAFIGPHIHQESFEFGKDTLEQYKTQYAPLIKRPSAIQDHTQNKVLIDLKSLAEYELNSLGVSSVHSLNINTFKSNEHHSYRRDYKQAGRNLTWIKIKK